MKKVMLNVVILVALCAIESSLYGQTVKIQGRKILVDNQVYRINGICYSRGKSTTATYTEDIALMKEANINTIRTYWYISDKNELDAFANAGIKIIMHLDENNYESYVNTYKDHPAILMWEFGNEFNYHPEWFGGNISTWYTKLESCASHVHQLDPNHPVSTAHGEVPTVSIINSCPGVDVWGMNLYRWDDDVPAIKELANNTTKAMYVSEAGGDSYNKVHEEEREGDQALATQNIVNGIINEFDLCAGICVFEFCDEWWKAGSDNIQNPGGSAPFSSGVPYDGSADEEYWGIVRRDRTKKEAFNTLRDIYATVPGTTSIESTISEHDIFEIYPNPFIDHFIVDLSNKTKQADLIQIIDTQGVVVFSKKLASNSGQPLDLNLDIKLTAGAYIVSLSGKDLYKTQSILIK